MKFNKNFFHLYNTRHKIACSNFIFNYTKMSTVYENWEIKIISLRNIMINISLKEPAIFRSNNELTHGIACKLELY